MLRNLIISAFLFLAACGGHPCGGEHACERPCDVDHNLPCEPCPPGWLETGSMPACAPPCGAEGQPCCADLGCAGGLACSEYTDGRASACVRPL